MNSQFLFSDESLNRFFMSIYQFLSYGKLKNLKYPNFLFFVQRNICAVFNSNSSKRRRKKKTPDLVPLFLV